MSDLFSVLLWFPDGSCNVERRGLDAEAAVRFAHSLTKRPAALLGAIARVTIIDDEDCTVFDWRDQQGVVFPNGEGTPPKEWVPPRKGV